MFPTDIYADEIPVLAENSHLSSFYYKSQLLLLYASYLKSVLSHTLEVHKVVYVKLWKGEPYENNIVI